MALALLRTVGVPPNISPKTSGAEKTVPRTAGASLIPGSCARWGLSGKEVVLLAMTFEPPPLLVPTIGLKEQFFLIQP